MLKLYENLVLILIILFSRQILLSMPKKNTYTEKKTYLDKTVSILEHYQFSIECESLWNLYYDYSLARYHLKNSHFLNIPEVCSSPFDDPRSKKEIINSYHNIIFAWESENLIINSNKVTQSFECFICKKSYCKEHWFIHHLKEMKKYCNQLKKDQSSNSSSNNGNIVTDMMILTIIKKEQHEKNSKNAKHRDYRTNNLSSIRSKN